MTPAEAEAVLAEWKSRADHIDAQRNPRVRAAYKAGVQIKRISEITGLSRTTIYKILGLDEETT